MGVRSVNGLFFCCCSKSLGYQTSLFNGSHLKPLSKRHCLEDDYKKTFFNRGNQQITSNVSKKKIILDYMIFPRTCGSFLPPQKYFKVNCRLFLNSVTIHHFFRVSESTIPKSRALEMSHKSQQKSSMH